MTGGLVQEFHHIVLPSVTPLATVVLSVLSMLVSGIGSVSDNFQEKLWIKKIRHELRTVTESNIGMRYILIYIYFFFPVLFLLFSIIC